MQQLTGREAHFLAAETRSNLAHHSLYVELEPVAGGPELTFQTLLDLVESRLHRLPGLRRRLHTVPLNLDRPWWLEDPDFDLDYHVRHLAVPSAGTEDALHALIGRLHERPLDRSRPLWEMYLIERHNGHPGLFVKVHHALVDGMTGLDILGPLAAELDPAATVPTPRRDRVPDDSDLLIRAGWRLARSPWRLAGLGIEASRHLPVLGGLATMAALAPWAVPRGVVELSGTEHTIHRTSFNRTLGTHRRVAFVSVPTEEIKALHRTHGVRFNDVVLALVAGTLRHWLVVHDELPPEPMVALTPLLVDSAEEPLATALVPLATHRHEPVVRLAEIAKDMAALAEQVEARPVSVIRSAYGAAPALAALASRLMLRTGAFTRLLPPFNVYVVNVPGDDEALVIAGQRVAHQFAIATLVDGAGLSITATSNGSTVDFSFVADRELVPDLEAMAEHLPRELAILAGRAEP